MFRPLALAAIVALAGGAVGERMDRAAGLRTAVPSRDLPGWKLVFTDDFRATLRPSRWGAYSGEPGGDPGGWWAPTHVRIRNGVLNLESYRDPAFGNRWVSGGVSSAPALRQTYGKYEVRFRIDRGKGVGAALLLWPSSEIWPPEIDFAEDGGETTARSHMAATLHYGKDDEQVQRTLRADFNRWHTMGVEWTPGKIAYTINGKRWATVRSSQVPGEPMELAIQTQSGTCGDRFAPCPDSSTPAHVAMQVDWVAAWAYRPQRN